MESVANQLEKSMRANTRAMKVLKRANSEVGQVGFNSFVRIQAQCKVLHGHGDIVQYEMSDLIAEHLQTCTNVAIVLAKGELVKAVQDPHVERNAKVRIIEEVQLAKLLAGID